MLKRIFSLAVLILCSFVILAGCDGTSSSSSSSGAGCGGDLDPSSPDVITFQLPVTNPMVAKYRVELIAPVTLKSLGVQEGSPGQTLTFELDQPYLFVDVILTAFDAEGDILSVTPALAVDLDWESPNCKIIAESNSSVNGTRVRLDVDCNGVDIDVDY